MNKSEESIFPWSKIFEYRDELNDHFDDINERILMVGKDEMNYQAAEKLNKKSLIRFHAKITKFLRESNINPQNDLDIEGKF